MGIEYILPEYMGFGKKQRPEWCYHAARCGLEGFWPGLRCVVSESDIGPGQWRPATPEDEPPAAY